MINPLLAVSLQHFAPRTYWIRTWPSTTRPWTTATCCCASIDAIRFTARMFFTATTMACAAFPRMSVPFASQSKWSISIVLAIDACVSRPPHSYLVFAHVFSCKDLGSTWYLGIDCGFPIQKVAFYAGMVVTLVCLLATMVGLTAYVIINKKDQTRYGGPKPQQRY